MANYLNIALPIVEKDLLTGEFKATEYFEDYLYQLVKATGGEGSETITEVNSASMNADKDPYFNSLVLSLKKQVEHLESVFSAYIVETVVKPVNRLESSFLESAVFSLKKKTNHLEGLLSSHAVDSAIKTTSHVENTHTVEAAVLSLIKKVGHLESFSSTHIVDAAVKQLQVDTVKFNTLIKQVNYTAKNKDYVEGRGNITLKFPANAVRGDEVIFANGDGGTITLNGNGNNIKFTSTDETLTMRRQGTSLHFHFFEDNDLNERYWRAR